MKDILLDGNNDIEVQSGDFVIGDSEIQHQNHIVIASKGEYKRNPEVGANILDMLSEDSPKEAINEIKRQLEYDGAKVENIIYKDGKLNIEATYG